MKWPHFRVERLFGTWSRTRAMFLFFGVLLVAALIVGGVHAYTHMRSAVLTSVKSHQTLHAELYAAGVAGKLRSVEDIVRVIATAPHVRDLIQQGKWKEAVDNQAHIVIESQDIDRIFIADASGVEKAATPSVPGGLVDSGYPYGGWYTQVTGRKAIVVTDAYLRRAAPQMDVVSVAAPVYDNDGSKMTGILVAQIPLTSLFGWTRGLSESPSTYVQFLDSSGQLVADSRGAVTGKLLGMDDNVDVQKALQGETGSETRFSSTRNENVLSSYAPVQGYGWAVLVDTPTRVLLSGLSGGLFETEYTLIALFALAVLSLLVVLYLSRTLARLRFRERAYLQHAGDGIAVVDRDWRIVLWNMSAEMITGRQAKDVLNRPFREAMPLLRTYDRKPNYSFIDQTIIEKRSHILQHDTLLVRADGSEVPVADSAAPILDDKGKVNGVIIIFRDATKDLERRLVKSSFAYASHQLRTPVTRALWALDEALESDDAHVRQRVSEARIALNSVHKLVTELAVVSELDQDMVVPRIGPASLTKIAIKVVDDLDEIAGERNVRVLFSDVGGDATVDTDPKLASMVIEEVVENAILYNRPKGTVRISIGDHKDGKLVSIADQGIGVMDDQKSTIFTKFFRGSNVPEGVVGAGLGLYIAEGYMRLLGGRIWFESEEEGGTKFFLFFPKGRKS